MEHIEKQVLIFFGVTGDLTKRKLIPALYALFHRGVLPESSPIMCVARRDYTKEEFIGHLDIQQFIVDTPLDKLDQFLELLHYCKIDFDGEDFGELADSLNQVDQDFDCKGNRTFFMSTPPFLYKRIGEIIANHNLRSDQGKTKIAIEKPFGYDLDSATDLNNHLAQLFDEEEIYRIDHYLGKELIQNILAFRFSNAVFEQVWNNQFIDHVQITVSEDLGVGTRGGYYDTSGAVRDMLQNHLLEILTLTAMNQPQSLKSQDIRDEKVAILNSLQEPTAEDIVLGQYSGDENHPGYLQEEGVKENSQTETYVATRAYINTPRWEGIPFYMRTGKRMPAKYAEVHVVFKDVKCELFVDENGVCEPSPNVITFKIQPEQSIHISFNAKKVGATLELEPAKMDFCYDCGRQTPESYQTLLESLLRGNQTYFTRWDRVEASWKYADAVNRNGKRDDFPNYKAFSSGPEQAEKLFTRFGRHWIQ